MPACDVKNKKSKVLLVFHDENNSGATLALLDLIKSWEKYSSMDIVCLLPKKKGEALEALKNRNVQVVSFRFGRSIRQGNESLIAIAKKYVEFIMGSFITLIYSAVFFTNKGFDIVYSNTSATYAGAIISSVLKIPNVWHVREYVDKERAVVTLLPQRMHYRVLKSFSTCIVTISKTCNDYYQRVLGNDCRIKMVYDDVRAVTTYIENWKEVKHKVLFVGNIMEGKGQMTALKALCNLYKRQQFNKAESESYHLTFVGSVGNNNYYNSMLDYIKENELQERVTFLGQINDVDRIRKEHGIAVVASANEPFGRVTIEGMLAGEIVIGANAGCTNELIQDRGTGFLFKPGDDEDLARIIDEVCLMDESVVEDIRKRAFCDASNYTKGDCAEKIREILEECLA